MTKVMPLLVVSNNISTGDEFFSSDFFSLTPSQITAFSAIIVLLCISSTLCTTTAAA
jgi:hypothetical protein